MKALQCKKKAFMKVKSESNGGAYGHRFFVAICPTRLQTEP
jgi:hypothetical protein